METPGRAPAGLMRRGFQRWRVPHTLRRRALACPALRANRQTLTGFMLQSRIACIPQLGAPRRAGEARQLRRQEARAQAPRVQRGLPGRQAARARQIRRGARRQRPRGERRAEGRPARVARVRAQRLQ